MSKIKKIPWSVPNISIEEKEAMQKVIESGWYSQGSVTKAFEDDLSEYVNSNVSVVNSGTSALMCALLANGFKPGDSVLVPNFTFFATLSAAKILGGKIYTSDVDIQTLNINQDSVEQIVKNNDIKFLIVVDVAGLPVDVDFFTDLAKRHNFILIEDSAESLGSEYKNKKIGSFEHTTTFSFHIAKQITTIEGGAISSNDEKIISKVKHIRDHGRVDPKNYSHELIGSNFRTTDLQSSIGIEQLKKITQHLSRRNEIVQLYKQKLKNVRFQETPLYNHKHSNMMFFVIYPNKEIRDKNFQNLQANGIDVKLPWPPLHIQPANPELNHNVHKNTELISNSSLMFPIFNTMTNDQVEYVIDSSNEINSMN